MLAQPESIEIGEWVFGPDSQIAVDGVGALLGERTLPQLVTLTLDPNRILTQDQVVICATTWKSISREFAREQRPAEGEVLSGVWWFEAQG